VVLPIPIKVWEIDRARNHKQYDLLTTAVGKMNTPPKKEKSDNQNKEDVEIKTVPKGTFAGTGEKPVLVKKGKVVPADTGAQGKGQN
jgi:hypothetical protein